MSISQKAVSSKISKQTYFDQNDVKSINNARVKSNANNSGSPNQTEANLYKYVEEYKTKKYGVKQQQKPDDQHNASFRQAKMVLYESLLGNNSQNRTNTLINMSRDYGISHKTDLKLRPTAKGYQLPAKNDSGEQISSSETKKNKQNNSVYNVNGPMKNEMLRKKRKSLNIDTSHMLLLQKHQLNMKVNSAFKYTKMLDRSTKIGGGATNRRDEDFVAPLSFHFPNTKPNGVLHHSEPQQQI